MTKNYRKMAKKAIKTAKTDKKDDRKTKMGQKCDNKRAAKGGKAKK